MTEAAQMQTLMSTLEPLRQLMKHFDPLRVDPVKMRHQFKMRAFEEAVQEVVNDAVEIETEDVGAGECEHFGCPCTESCPIAYVKPCRVTVELDSEEFHGWLLDDRTTVVYGDCKRDGLCLEWRAELRKVVRKGFRNAKLIFDVEAE